MNTLDRIIQLSQDYVSSARRELLNTRKLTSENEHDLQDLKNNLQRLRILGDNGLGLNFGSLICDYLESRKSLQNSRNALATHLSIAMSFVVEALDLIVQNKGVDASLYSYIHSIRTVLNGIRHILSDYDTKQIPKDGIASAIARAEAITRISESPRFAEIKDVLMGIRQSIVYY